MSATTLQCDQDLQQRVSQFLWDRRMPSLRELSVEAADGIVTVHGRVGSYYEKQLCQHICRRVAGVIKLVDRVAVVPSPSLAAV